MSTEYTVERVEKILRPHSLKAPVYVGCDDLDGDYVIYSHDSVDGVPVLYIRKVGAVEEEEV